MKYPTIKYVRIEESKLIVVPTKEGESLFNSLADGTDTIGGTPVKAKVKEFKGVTIKNFHWKSTPATNQNLIYVFTSDSNKFNLVVPCYIEVKEEVKK
jgi:hypothetical protein